MQAPFEEIPDWLAGVIGAAIIAFAGWVAKKVWQRWRKERAPISAPAIKPVHEMAIIQGAPNISGLLSWQTSYGDFLPGREEQERKLREWAKNRNRHAGFAILQGPGGAGKTRLAAELALALRKEGWAAGFILPHDDPAQKLDVTRFKATNLLLIIDYPEQRSSEELERIFKAVGEWRARQEKLVRVLLLTREERHEVQENWRKAFIDHVRDATAGEDAAFYLGLHRLGARDALALARQVHDALGDRLALNGANFFHRLAGGWQERFAEWLKKDVATHGLPLFVIGAVVEAMLRGKADFSLSGGELLQALGRREIHRLRGASAQLGLGEHCLPRLAALASLAGDLGEQALQRLQDTEICEKFPSADSLRGLPWWKVREHRGRLEQIQPDKLAAAVFHQVFIMEVPVSLPQWIVAAIVGREKAFNERLPRLLWDLEQVHGADTQAREAFYQVLQEVVDLLPAGALEKIAFTLSEHDGHLIAPLHIAALKKLLSPDLPTAKRADLLNNLAVKLSEVGQRQEALEAIKEAVKIYRDLAEQNPKTFQPYLAVSLNNLVDPLSKMGQRQEALEAIKEAVEILRELAEQNPKAFRPDLAMSLHNLANRLSKVGQRQEALKTIKEAVEIYRELAEQNPQAFRPDLAMSLHNLANRLSEVGQRQEALEAIEEAVKIYRELVGQNPQAFRPDLARSLGAQSMILQGLERPAEAAAAAQEGLKILLPFVKKEPQAFAGLAEALAKEYMKACEKAGREPDIELLNKVTKILPPKTEEK